MTRTQKVHRLENVVGWYHSHPGYGCWLSGIDCSTQMLNQQFQVRDSWFTMINMSSAQFVSRNYLRAAILCRFLELALLLMAGPYLDTATLIRPRATDLLLLLPSPTAPLLYTLQRNQACLQALFLLLCSLPGMSLCRTHSLLLSLTLCAPWPAGKWRSALSGRTQRDTSRWHRDMCQGVNTSYRPTHICASVCSLFLRLFWLINLTSRPLHIKDAWAGGQVLEWG